MLVLKYPEAVYRAKISELQTCKEQLQTHLGRLEEYKSEIFDFWKDEHARSLSDILLQEIELVKNQMDHVDGVLKIYEEAAGKLDALNSGLADDLAQVLQMLVSF